MAHEYDDPLNEETIGATVARALVLHGEVPDVPLESHVERAVHECVCSCAVDIEDSVEHGRSGLHATLAREVRERVERHLATSGTDRRDDVVDLASKQSFPASDPPGWIGGPSSD